MRRTVTLILLPALVLMACARGADTSLSTGTSCAEPECMARLLSALRTGDRIRVKAPHGESFGAELVSFREGELVVRSKWYGPGLSEGAPSQRDRNSYPVAELRELEVLSEDPTGVERREGTVGLVVMIVLTLALLSVGAASLWF